MFDVPSDAEPQDYPNYRTVRFKIHFRGDAVDMNKLYRQWDETLRQ